MKHWLKILLAVLGALALAFGVLVTSVVWASRPTTGSHIPSYSDSRAAVLVVDIQEDFTGPSAVRRYHDGDRIVAATNRLLEYARTKALPVVYVRNVIEHPVMKLLAGGMNARAAPGTEIDRRIVRVPGAKTFDKGRSDAFSNSELDAFLRSQQVDHVLIVGLDGKYCVDRTARGALNRGYKVTLLRDGIATESSTPVSELSDPWRQAGASVTTVGEFAK
jgi:nicotinamidase-related amidase